MPIVGLSLSAVREYESVHDSERGKPGATKFSLGTLDSHLLGRLKDKATSLSMDPSNPEAEVVTNINANEVAFETVCYGLKGWENFNDDAGKPIKFKSVKRTIGAKSYSVADPELVSQIPEVVVAELAEQIRAGNDVSETEAKN